MFQRLVTSNPSASYVQSVGDAFRSGTYEGTVFSGEYGNLAATAAAVVLHPESQQSALGVNAKYSGTLREPLSKIAHLLRAMESRDNAASMVVFSNLQDVIGQFPYYTPRVFNFFDAEFAPSVLVSEASGSLPGPELEIFTPGYVSSYVNLMASVIERGQRCRVWDPGFRGRNVCEDDFER